MSSRFDTIPACDGHPATHPAEHAIANTLYASSRDYDQTACDLLVAQLPEKCKEMKQNYK